MAILAVAFVVLAAVPAAVTDSESEADAPSAGKVVLTPCEGVSYLGTTPTPSGDSVSLSSGNNLTLKISLKTGYKLVGSATAPVVKINGETTTSVEASNGVWTYSNIVNGANSTDAVVITVSGVEEITYTDKDLKGTITATDSTTYGVYDRAVVADGTVIGDGTTATTVDVKGVLYVPSGVTLTIKAGATLTAAAADIDGKVVIEGTTGALVLNGESDIDGTVEVGGTLTVGSGADVALDGTMTVTSAGTLTQATAKTMTVGTDAVLTVQGKAQLNVDVEGTVIFDSKVGAAEVSTVNLIADGAKVDVQNYTNTYNSEKTLTVTDNGALKTITADGKTKTTISSGNSIVITPGLPGETGNGIISGIVIEKDSTSETASDTGLVTYTSILDVSGTIAASAVNDTTAKAVSTAANVALTGNSANAGYISVTDELVVGNDVVLANAGPLTVTGTIDATAAAVSGSIAKAAASMTNTAGPLTVTGEGEIVGNSAVSLASNINAVMYTKNVNKVATNFYVDVEAALTAFGATDNEVELKLYGTVELNADGTLPANNKLNIQDSSELKIAEDATLTVAKDATLTGTKVTVNGALYAENATDDQKATTTVADVKSVGSSTETWALWTNVYDALENADDGDTVVANGNITIGKDVTIPAGVTLELPTGKKLQPTEANKVTVTVAGTLYSADALTGYVAKATASYAALVLSGDGIVVSAKAIAYSATDFSAANGVAGAYYQMFYGDTIAYAMSSVDTAIDNVDDIYGTITLNGEIAQDIAIEGSDYCTGITVAAGSSLEGDVDLTDASLTIVNTGKFEGNVTGGENSIYYEGSTYISNNTVTFAYDAEDDELTITGIMSTGADFTVLEGIVYEIAGANIAVANVTVDEDAILCLTTATNGTIDVYGKLNVPAGATAAAITVNLYGDAVLSVAEKTSSLAAGKFTVTTLNAGASASKLFDDSAVEVEGAVTMNVTSNAGVIYAASTATIDEDTLGDMKNTTYFVGDDAFLTVYVVTGSVVKVDAVKYAPVEDAYFAGTWQYVGTDGKLADITADTTVVSGTYEEVYAATEDEIYEICIRAQDGITNVYLNGEMMVPKDITVYGVTVSAFYAKVAAGSYRVTAALDPAYSGSVVLTVDGKVVSGNVIVAAGEPEGEAHTVAIDAQLTIADSSVASEDMIVSIKALDDGSVYVIVTALDGGYIPAGKITVELNYSVYKEALDDWVDYTDTVEVDLTGSTGAYLAQIVDLTGSEVLPQVSSIQAFVTIDDDELSSDIVAYSYTEA